MALCAPVVALSLLVACGREDPLNEPAERFEMVDIDYERAIRLSVAEVTAGELVALELKEPESNSPVWESRIADQDGQLTTVRLGATRGEVLGTSPGPDLADSERQELMRHLDEARLLPGEAAREAADTANGELVTALELQGREGDPVWRVDVLGVADESATVHVVDAKTGEILERRPA
ncbi:PepSY domain-containing protein [Streptomyces sp. NEAU-W12]|uniref:PepSY domain-containing protein n=1 Tax=Streptomyces sp. NEAU-W12 TaxID=2994668 RepID=UPI00224A98CB|nr:PepSY domain-containing protein [Streptomyces sp. NEAU-W12]MCX2923337.1 PepSY domain-containing protein [Streptomyces sp. NEAU-W12]